MDEQLTIGIVLFITLVLFVWGRWRYDLVALLALLTLCIVNIIPADEAFTGFGHPAVITVAAVLILSRALVNAGIVQLLAQKLGAFSDALPVQIALLTGLVTILSGFINNIGALALLMPVAIRLARDAGHSPSAILMPMAFGSLLGGTLTLIGTPANIIVASYRGDIGNSAFTMFDFFPVGAAVAIAGVLFIVLIGWRLIPQRQSQSSREQMFEIDDYIAELSISEDSKALDMKLSELEAVAENEGDVTIIALVRGERRIDIPPAYERLRADDHLIVEADTESLKNFIGKTDLKLAGNDDEDDDNKHRGSKALQSEDSTILEAIILPDSRLIGNTSKQINLRWRYGINLIGVARQGSRIKRRLQNIRFSSGDVLLLQGPAENLYEALQNLGCLPLAERDLNIGQPRRIALTLGLFAGAILVNSFGLLPVHIAMASAAVLMIVTRLVSLRDAYAAIDWPIIVLLGAMLPVGAALETTGAAGNIAAGLADMAVHLPAIAVVGLLLFSTMVLTDVINNAAAAVLMAPIGMSLANYMDVSADPMLMAIAIGASCSFLTPIGHQSNTLVMGPGGYRFGDYWRMGLPLELLVMVVALPMLVWVWPL
ncbi:MAG: SLC13 family permease [Gammaproteobacteria bacterium]